MEDTANPKETSNSSGIENCAKAENFDFHIFLVFEQWHL
jgi:hypothetical protein